MTAALEAGEWSAARPGRTLPPGKTRYSFYRRLGGPQGRSVRAENLVPIGILSRTVQPVFSRYTCNGIALPLPLPLLRIPIMQYSTISRENLVARNWYRPFGKQLHQHITITSLNSVSAGNHLRKEPDKGCRGRVKQLLALFCV